jgi:type IV secretory pathway VirB4 component
VLYQRADEERDAGAHEIAAVLRSLAERLHDFIGAGAYAYLTDSETSIPERAPLIAFDTKDIPDEVVPAALFIIAEAVIRRVEAQRDQVVASGVREDDWSARTFLVLDEAWKLVQRPATGRLVMEWGKRSRHLALWLIAITQQMEDLNNQYGRALLDNASMRLFLNQEEKELQIVQDSLALSDEAIASIKNLTTSKRQFSTAYLMHGRHGQGAVTIQVSDYEYWIATNDPARDEPLRRRALSQAVAERQAFDFHAHGRALQLLADPAWHEAQRAHGAPRLSRAS